MTIVLTVLNAAWLLSALLYSSNVATANVLSTGVVLTYALGALLTAGTMAQFCLVVRTWRRRLGIGAWGGVLVGPLAFAIFLAAVALDVPFQIRFMAGRSDLETFAEGMFDGRQTPDGIRGGRVGTFSIQRWFTRDNCAHLVTTDGFGEGGLAYCRKGEPQERSGTEYGHVTGPWYWWTAQD